MAESKRVRSGSTLDDWMYKDILPPEEGGSGGEHVLSVGVDGYAQYANQAYVDRSDPAAVRRAVEEGRRREQVAKSARDPRRMDAIEDLVNNGGTVTKLEVGDSGTGYAWYKPWENTLEAVITRSGAAEEPGHLKNHRRDIPKSDRDSGGNSPKARAAKYGSAGYYSVGAEADSAKSSLKNYAWGRHGENNMHGENVTRFWSEIMDQYESSGESSIDFVNGLDMPKNARGAVKAYIDDTPGARAEFGNPESWDWIVKNGDADTSAMAAQKGGDLSEMSNFLATDEVPPALFGVPVVSAEEQYTEKDLAFFKEHPEAGGYYDMGVEDA